MDKNNLIEKVDKVNLEFLDNQNKKNNIFLKKIKQNKYQITGSSFNAEKLIDSLLIGKKDNNLKLFQNDIEISLNLKEIYLDNLYLVNDLNGSLNIKNNEIYAANISGDFDNVNNLKFTVNTNDVGEKITNPEEAKQNFDQNNAEDIYDGLKSLKGSALKVAQMLSMEKNLMPQAFVEQFSLAQFSVPPLSPPLVKKTFKKYQGKYPQEIFDEFQTKSSFAASIGQVHKARKGDTEFAVKIQYPGVANSIQSDLALVKPFALRMFNIKGKDSDRYFKEVEEKLTEEMKAEQLRTANGDLALDPEADRLRQEALDKLSTAEAVGRLVIPLQNIVDGIADDLVLEDGDALIIPGYRQEVSIVGEVQQPTSYLYSRGLTVQDYVDLSGGARKSADAKGIYLVKASGQVIMPKRALFRFGSKNAVVEPGDTIVVPLDTDDKKLSGISLLTEVSQIIYQLSLGAAAINSLNP